ncbi:MAG: glycine--tRNA ligase subunit beta, partial [Nostoc sp.]
TFQAKLGSYADKTRRVIALATLIGDQINAGVDVEPAARLAKADLMTAMVGEFPELQGTMGRYYAEAEGLPAGVALAIEAHYRPRYAGDAIPATAAGQAVALADKLDTLVGIFAIE